MYICSNVLINKLLNYINPLLFLLRQ